MIASKSSRQTEATRATLGFLAPADLTIPTLSRWTDQDISGFAYVNRCVNQPCRKISSAGVLVKSWGIGLLNGPEDIAIESQGSVYVANYFNNRVEKFLGDGTFVAAWSSLGDEDGQLSGPAGVVVDGTGYVYLADSGNNRVQMFSPLPPSPHTAGGSGGRCYLRWGRSVRSNFSLCGIFQWFGS